MKLYPVVHMRSSEHALELSQQALEAGADGVFLIDHRYHDIPDILTDAYAHVREELGREAFIGVNYLGLEASDTVRYLANAKRYHLFSTPPDALWADNAVGDMRTMCSKCALHLENMRYFGGVAFKYTPDYTADPVEAAALAREWAAFVDVVTTSGPGTGSAADVAKVAAMKQAIGDKELALASGVTAENMALYAPHVDAILAASSIETAKCSGVFVEDKLRALVQAAHEHQLVG